MSTEIRKQKRILILNCATDMFSQKGFDRTRVEEIAKLAGVGKSTIYEYFSSKEDLLLEVIRFQLVEYNEELLNIMNSNKTLKEKLIEQVKLNRDVLFKSIHNICLTADTFIPPVHKMREIVDTQKTFMLDVMSKAIKCAIQNGEVRDDYNIELLNHMIANISFAYAPHCIQDLQSNEDISAMIHLIFDGIGKK